MPCFETAGHTAGHCKHKTLGKTPVKQLLTVLQRDSYLVTMEKW